MQALDLIWISIFALNGVVLLAALGILLRLFVGDVLRRRSARRRDDIVEILLSPDTVSPVQHIRPFRNPAALAGLLHVLTLLRGRECARVVERARALGAIKTLCRALQCGSVRQRVGAAEGLGYFQGECSRLALSRAVSDSDPQVGVAALKSLIKLGDGAALFALRARIRKHGAGRQSALAAVLREAALLRPADIAFALEEETRPNLQILLIDAVAAVRMNRAAAVLRRLAAEGEAGVQTAARQALSRCQDAATRSAA